MARLRRRAAQIGSTYILLIAGIVALGPTAQAQSSGAGQTVSVNGMEMYYEIHGDGDPLVLLHGITMRPRLSRLQKFSMPLVWTLPST